MFIAIDHGNKQIKTANHIFTSGLLESTNHPAFGDEILYFQGKYYSLSENRIPYMRDKTATEQFFVLSLFAIAKEITTAGKYVENDLTEVRLNIGLPPSHYSALYQKYEDYFKKPDIVDFTYNGKPYSIYIAEVTAYPQAYAAAMTVYSLIKEQPKALVLDIGGGSILLREFIEGSRKLGGSIIIDDIAANAKGYDILYRASHRR